MNRALPALSSARHDRPVAQEIAVRPPAGSVATIRQPCDAVRDRTFPALSVAKHSEGAGQETPVTVAPEPASGPIAAGEVQAGRAGAEGVAEGVAGGRAGWVVGAAAGLAWWPAGPWCSAATVVAAAATAAPPTTNASRRVRRGGAGAPGGSPGLEGGTPGGGPVAAGAGSSGSLAAGLLTGVPGRAVGGPSSPAMKSAKDPLVYSKTASGTERLPPDSGSP